MPKKKTPPDTPPSGRQPEPPPEGMVEVHEQLFRTPKHGHGRLKVGGNNGGGRPRNELRRLVEKIGLELAAPRLAHIIATSDSAQTAAGASGIILKHALPTTLEVEGDIEHRYVIVAPPKAKSTKDWLKLHAKGEA